MKNSLLKETGRISENPIFIVGMFSGVDKIGEGYGSSLKMAETRVMTCDAGLWRGVLNTLKKQAIKDALMKHYAIDIQKVNLPSMDLDNEGAEDTLSFFEKEAVTN